MHTSTNETSEANEAHIFHVWRGCDLGHDLFLQCQDGLLGISAYLTAYLSPDIVSAGDYWAVSHEQEVWTMAYAFSLTKVWTKSYGSALVKPPIGIVTAFAND